jgi:hypothetical protein
VATRLVQTTCIHNRGKKNHIYLRNVLSKKKGHLVTNVDSILFVIAKDNSFFELQGFLEQKWFYKQTCNQN